MHPIHSMKIKVEVSGGLELLCGGVKIHELEVEQESVSMKELLDLMKGTVVRERSELFLQGQSVRPGILVLINDVDWELEGTMEYSLQDKDHIVFISTLHGG